MKAKRIGDVAQVIEHLSNKCKFKPSIASPAKKKDVDRKDHKNVLI
jgi:hypothetical protein